MHISRFTVFVIMLFATALALAQAGPGPGRGPIYDPSTEATLKGTIEDIQQHPGRGMGTGTHLLLKTDGGTLDVHVGPSDFIASHGFVFAKGEKVEVTGSKVKLGGSDALLAREIKKDGKVLTLRNAQGIPEWSRARSNTTR